MECRRFCSKAVYPTGSRQIALARQDEAPSLLHIRRYLQDNGQTKAPLVNILQNISSVIGEDRIKEFLDNDEESKLLLENSFNAFAEERSILFGDGDEAEPKTIRSSPFGFLNPILSFLDKAKDTRGQSLIDSVRFMWRQNRSIQTTTTTTEPTTTTSGTPKKKKKDTEKSGRSFPWNIKNGRCLIFSPTVVMEERVFKYAAEPCGYERYYLCQAH